MNDHKELKYLIEQNARHLAHLQRRIDMLHATLEAFLPMLVSAASHPHADLGMATRLSDQLLADFAQTRDQKIARLSEAPFVGLEPPSDESA